MSQFKIAFTVLAVSLSSLAGCAVQTGPEPSGSSSAAVLGCVSSQGEYCPPPSTTAADHPLECVSIPWPTDPTSQGKKAQGCTNPQFCDEFEPYESVDYYQADCHGTEVEWNDPLCSGGDCAPSLKGKNTG